MNADISAIRSNKSIVYPDVHVGEAPLAAERDATYSEWRKSGPVVWVEGLLGAGSWFVVSHELCEMTTQATDLFSREVFRDFNNAYSHRVEFPQAAWLKHSLYFRDEPVHSTMRRIFENAFEENVLNRVEIRIKEYCGRIRSELERREEFDLVHDIAWPLACAVSEFVGIDHEDAWRFPIWEAERIGSRFLKKLPAESLEVINADSMGDQVGFIRRLMAHRRREPNNDVITNLVVALDGGCVIAEEAVAWNLLFLSRAAFITFRDQLSGAILALLQSPDQAAMVARNVNLLPNAIEELFRLTAPDQLHFQIAVRDVEIGGVLVRAGELVTSVLGAANRDPDVFIDPYRLDVGRSNASTHLSSLASSHICLMLPLVKVAVSAVIRCLANDFSNWKIQFISWSDALQERAPRRVLIKHTAKGGVDT